MMCEHCLKTLRKDDPHITYFSPQGKVTGRRCIGCVQPSTTTSGPFPPTAMAHLYQLQDKLAVEALIRDVLKYKQP